MLPCSLQAMLIARPTYSVLSNISIFMSWPSAIPNVKPESLGGVSKRGKISCRAGLLECGERVDNVDAWPVYGKPVINGSKEIHALLCDFGASQKAFTKHSRVAAQHCDTRRPAIKCRSAPINTASLGFSQPLFNHCINFPKPTTSWNIRRIVFLSRWRRCRRRRRRRKRSWDPPTRCYQPPCT